MSTDTQLDFKPVCPIGETGSDEVTLSHGGGGRLTHQLINDVFEPGFANPQLVTDHDGALLDVSGIQLAFTTDSYVVRPCFFPGGDIGTLAVNGTVNDLAMCGAKPLYLSVGMILEEGFSIDALKQIVQSMRNAAGKAGVHIVTGDTKVVDKGHGDGVYINTSGVGLLQTSNCVSPAAVLSDDVIILSGDIGRHGMAVMSVREGLSFQSPVESDTAALHEPILALIDNGIDVHCMRDPTRGGLATSLIEIAQSSGMNIDIEESLVRISDSVRGACEILGLDPLYVANEGRFIIVVPPGEQQKALSILQAHPVCRNAAVIGKVSNPATTNNQPGMDISAGLVTATTGIGGQRVLDMLSGEQLPRIC